MLKVGFIGLGNMASAMIGGIRKAHPDWSLYGVDSDHSKVALAKKTDKLQICPSIEKLAQESRLIVLAVKPESHCQVLRELKPFLAPHHIIVTIAVGYSLERTQSYLNNTTKILRSMPNTPALVGAAVTAIVANDQLTAMEKDECASLFKSFGEVIFLEEPLFDIFSAISGSLPAYICMIVEALSDAAVQHGLPREKSYAIITQAILGSAKWIGQSKEHPAYLKDQVCSPGGTTIAAIAALEKGRLRNTLIDAINACVKRTKELA